MKEETRRRRRRVDRFYTLFQSISVEKMKDDETDK